MPLLNTVITWLMKNRISQIQDFIDRPIETQQQSLISLLATAKGTEWGRKYGYADLKNADAYIDRVPISTYEETFPYIERMMKGEGNLLWPTEIKWFAKSSGTTNARSKFIPVSQEVMEGAHFRGGKDMMTLYVHNNPDTLTFDGKGLSIGGSLQSNVDFEDSYFGDVSAVVMKNLPLWAQFIRTPNLEIALMDNWEEKIEKMAQFTKDENVTSILGVPTWTIVLIERILQITGKENITEVWPNLEIFVHGAVAFGPYRSLFEKLIPKEGMNYMDIYNASEGFFAIQDRLDADDMLLMLDYGIYYEFIPMGESDDSTAIPLEKVEVGVNYAIVISTNGGLWRYKIGDTVKFTSTDPHRIRISGRTKHFINAFGEEVIIENAEAALTKACEVHGATMHNFTVAPRYLEDGKRGSHEWVIEFERAPKVLDTFADTLDAALREVNSDYDAKRTKDLALNRLIIHSAPTGTFYKWLKSKGKLGGQHKVPRLANNRVVLEEVLELMK